MHTFFPLMDCFPTEITTQILSRLPIKYVFRCRCVCKTWKNIIDNRRLFAPLHFTRSLEQQATDHNKSTFIFAFTGNRCPTHPVYIVDKEQSQNHFKSTQIDISDSYHNIVYGNSCDGLLCFSSKSTTGLGYSTYIQNPVTRECIMLPNSDSYSDSSQESNYVVRIYTFSPYVYNLGFGFDYSSNVFKVLQVLYMSYDSRYSIPVNAQVYTVGSNSWRKLENFPRVPFFGSAPAIINGSLHWLSDQHILSFDLGSENFGFVEFPPINLSRGYGYRPYNNYRLVALDGCLSIADSSFDEDIDLWIMKDYNVKESWIKLIIKRRYVENGVLFQKVLPISFWRKGELLLVYGSKILVSYEIESGRYIPFEIEGLLESRSNCFKGSRRYVIFPYVGNLMPIDTTCRMTAQP